MTAFTIQIIDTDTSLARKLPHVLEWKAGRVLVNGFRTVVEAVNSMLHGGPYPASTNFGAASRLMQPTLRARLLLST
jgi:hypothetical protein